MKTCKNCNIDLFQENNTNPNMDTVSATYHKNKINIIIKLLVALLIFGIIFHYFYLLK